MKQNRQLGKMILEVVDNQLQAGKPPETRATFQRLLDQGISQAEAKRLIACVVAGEMFDVLRTDQPFNPERFTAALNRLPELAED
jgi:hypothetical protein